MDAALVQRCLAEAGDLAAAAFRSPLWDPSQGKWFRAIRLSDGRPDRRPHLYYDLCNVYALGRAMQLVPELAAWRGPWMDAVNWLFWELSDRPWIGYDTLDLKDRRDQYAMALAPAALAAAFAVAGRPALRSRAAAVYERYRKRFAPGAAPNVQAASHFILSALALAEATGESKYVDDAKTEGAFLLDRCRFTDGPAAGCFTDDFRQTAFPRHCYGAWAMTALYEKDTHPKWLEAAAASMEWWRARQLADGGFHFFFDARAADWSDRTVYSVHQKGMFLHSAWAINHYCENAYASMIERAMACCDDPQWRFASPDGWRCYRRSNVETDTVYSYELGWEVLGLCLAARYAAPSRTAPPPG